MQRFLAAAAVLVAIGAPSSAEVKYDRSIEAAAARILAAKIGDIRGSFAPGEEPVFVSGRRTGITGSVMASGWPEGLVRARDPHKAVFISF